MLQVELEKRKLTLLVVKRLLNLQKDRKEVKQQ